MEHIEVVEKAGLTAFFVAITAAIGWLGWLIVLFVASMGTDYLSGTALALRQGVWSSEEARRGLWHKAGAILAALVAIMLDGVVCLVVENVEVIQLPFTYSSLIFPLVLVWYILTELGSIIENIGLLGVPVPHFLESMVKVLKAATEGAGKRQLPKDEEK